MLIINVIIQDTCSGFNYPKSTEMRILIWYSSSIEEDKRESMKEDKKTEEKEIKKRIWRVKARNTLIREGEEEAERKQQW